MGTKKRFYTQPDYTSSFHSLLKKLHKQPPNEILSRFSKNKLNEIRKLQKMTPFIILSPCLPYENILNILLTISQKFPNEEEEVKEFLDDFFPLSDLNPADRSELQSVFQNPKSLVDSQIFLFLSPNKHSLDFYSEILTSTDRLKIK